LEALLASPKTTPIIFQMSRPDPTFQNKDGKKDSKKVLRPAKTTP
jgi:hypothetical protein